MGVGTCVSFYRGHGVLIVGGLIEDESVMTVGIQNEIIIIWFIIEACRAFISSGQNTSGRLGQMMAIYQSKFTNPDYDSSSFGRCPLLNKRLSLRRPL